MYIQTTVKTIKHTAIVTAAVAVCFFSACGNHEGGKAAARQNGDTVPTMRVYDVSTVISDSGVTRYRATAPEWLVYNTGETPHWNFPKGMRIEQFDTNLETEANIYCDTGYYNVGMKLWRLRKNVKVTNRKGEKFETDELFWDQAKAKVYSKVKVKIEQPNCIITGTGFESNETMTNYVIKHPEGVIPVKDK